MEKSISQQAAAEALSVHPVTIRRLITAGKLKAFKVGRVWRIREVDLLEYTRRKDKPK